MKHFGIHHFEQTRDAGNGIVIKINWLVAWTAEAVGTGGLIQVEDVEIHHGTPSHVELTLCKTRPIEIGEESHAGWDIVWQSIMRQPLTVAEIVGEIAEGIREKGREAC